MHNIPCDIFKDNEDNSQMLDESSTDSDHNQSHNLKDDRHSIDN